jgi:putative SOS response-associated peptidase YedK
MKPDGKTPVKLPVEMNAPANPAICFAGLWSRTTFGGKEIETCSIVTRATIAPLDKLHDRMPVIVSPDDYRDWLNPEITDVSLFERVTQAEPPATFAVLERGPGR